MKHRFITRRRTIVLLIAAIGLLAAIVGSSDEPKRPAQPPEGPFGYSLIRTPDGSHADLDLFQATETCGVCHPRQLEEIQGSMHLASHTDPLYRATSELARKEAGPKIYAYCSGCHAPAGVLSGLIPATQDEELPVNAKQGVTCDVCHQVSALTGATGPWKEPGNASLVIQQGRVKYGSSGNVVENRNHTGEKRDYMATAEFCASCHTVIHPINGFRIETTYDEWKSSVYFQKGIQCQDCHMRTVEEAQKVAETLQPVVLKGQSAVEGLERQIHRHFFVGGNSNADTLADGGLHAQMAEDRLRSAARLEIQAPAKAAAGQEFSLDVLVHNVAAGHHIPTGVSELRRIWVELKIVNSKGKVLFHSGELDEHGDFPPGTIWFGAVARDAAGNPTFKPWEMTGFLQKRTIPPKGFARDTLICKLPSDASGPLTIEAKLLYRSAPAPIVAAIMKEDTFAPKIVDMATAQASVTVE